MTRIGPCSLPPGAIEERVREWHALSPALIRGEVTPTGAALHYRLDRSVAEALPGLVEAEQHCCPSLMFDVTVTVRIDAPEAVRPWLRSTFVPDADGLDGTARVEGAGVDRQAIEEAVRAHYAAAAAKEGCCQEGCCHRSEGSEVAGIGPSVYAGEEREALPEQVVRSSIGCANPVAVAELAEGEVVLDLGSGGGLDVLLSARRVGRTGKAYGLDMTEEMLELARRNQADARVDNAEFLQGHIEAIPLPDGSVDVVLSNCVIGLSTDKRAVFAEAHRVLRPGGRLALADVVADTEASPEQRADVESWVSCLAGALTRSQYRAALASAGFAAISIDESHPVAPGFSSVVVRAVKPGRAFWGPTAVS